MTGGIRTLASLVVLGVVAVGGVYAYTALTPKSVCETGIEYRIGAVDERFGLSEEEFKSVLVQAANVWNLAAGKQLITYSADAKLPVSLKYDERQATAELGKTIDTDQTRYESQRARVDTLVARHEADAAQYESDSASFKTLKDAYDADIAEWNSKGGAPPAEYERLEARRRSLVRFQANLNADAAELNADVETINAEVQKLNALAEIVNAKVGEYNQVAGAEFDQGQYVEDEDGKRITIYEFRTKEQLVRALAHEFGHALGILHTEAPNSLMYPYNSGKSLALHAEDLAALRAICTK